MASNDRTKSGQQLDKDRFDKLKEMETERGRDEKAVRKIAGQGSQSATGARG
jgi:hypothetical protein